MKMHIFNEDLLRSVGTIAKVSLVGVFASAVLTGCTVLDDAKLENSTSTSGINNTISQTQKVETSKNNSSHSNNIVNKVNKNQQYVQGNYSKDISEDYEYLYVGDASNINLNDENFIKYKDTDNAFTRPESNFENSGVSISNESLYELNNFLRQYNVEIPYSELFNLEHLINKKNEALTNVTHDKTFSLTNGLVDSNILYSVVKKNNDNYSGIGFYKLSDSELRNVCNIITNVVNDNIKNNDYVDLNSLLCNLSTLKIMGEKDMTNARITYDNVLGISRDMINNLQNSVGSEYNAFEMTIAHEAEHLSQINCDHEVDKTTGNIIGFTQKWSDEPINSLFWNWYYEASAETMTANHYDTENIVYENMTNYLKFIKMAMIPNSDFRIDALEKVSVSRNPQEFYNLFGANTLEKQIEIAQIMYAIELIQNQNKDFEKLYILYNNLDGNILSSDEWIEIKRELKASLSINLTKMFYENLAVYVQSNQVTLNDIYYLISVFEAEVESHIFYDSINKFYVNESFMSSYVEMQEAFFSSISTDLNYGVEEITSGFNSYSFKDNKNLNGMNDEKIEFLEDREEDLILHTTTNISSTYNTLQKQYQKQKVLTLS